MSIRVVLADDHKILLAGLRALLEEEGIEVVGEAQTGREVLSVVAELQPDIVVMDVGMPDLNGMEATRQIRATAPAVKVIALSMHVDRRYVGGMLRAGASGYVVKSQAAEELIRAIHDVVSGQHYLSADVAGIVITDYIQHIAGTAEGDSAPLTSREREVLQLLAEGRKTGEIAAALYISEKTAATHRQHIMEKLGIHTVAGLTKYAIREGLTGLEA